MQRTKIEYLTHSWNPIAMQCTPISEGCQNCWHLAMCRRMEANDTLQAERRRAASGGTPYLLNDELYAPTRLRKPATIGVQFMGDLFHERVHTEKRAAVFRVMQACPRHTFLLLTKRPWRIPVTWPWVRSDGTSDGRWPRHVWVGVTVENQTTAKERIPFLLKVGAAIRFISFEPLLEKLHTNLRGIDWIILGPETGVKCRPCPEAAIHTLLDEADYWEIPVFIKKMIVGGKISSDMTQWPEWARRQEWPK